MAQPSGIRRLRSGRSAPARRRSSARIETAGHPDDGVPVGGTGYLRSAQVAEVVEDLLPSGTCSVQQVCRRLGLRPPELQRLLAEEGTGFSDVVHATRRRLVERYLGGERYSLTDISQLLGLAAPSGFSRWFHQQFGTSPTSGATVRDPTVPAVGSSVRDDAAPPPH